MERLTYMHDSADSQSHYTTADVSLKSVLLGLTANLPMKPG